MSARSGEDQEGLLVWAFATFNTAAFVLVAVLLLFRGGALGGILQSLNTAVGLGLFVVLWATTCYTTARALRGLSWSAAQASQAAPAFFPRALRWGGVNGMLFLALLGAGFLAALLATSPNLLGALFFALVVGPVALVVAFAVGATIGVVLGALDLALLALARRIVSSCTRTEWPSAP